MRLRTEAHLRLERARQPDYYWEVRRGGSSIRLYVEGDHASTVKYPRIGSFLDFTKNTGKIEALFEGNLYDEAIAYTDACWAWSRRLNEVIYEKQEYSLAIASDKLTSNLGFLFEELCTVFAEAVMHDQVVDAKGHNYKLVVNRLKEIDKYNTHLKKIYKKSGIEG